MELRNRIKETSIEHFGFMVQRPSRIREYSWILEEMDRESGHTTCDVGAGTSPVPIILAEDWWSVDTVDYWKEETSDEWGFINYQVIHPNIQSFNQDFSTFNGGPYDVIYSISAVEHMPAEIRRKVFQNSSNLLHPDGIFLCTMDVKKGMIHNRNYGQTIEEDHGTISDVVNELSDHFDAVLHWTEEFKGQGQDVLFIKGIK